MEGKITLDLDQFSQLVSLAAEVAGQIPELRKVTGSTSVSDWVAYFLLNADDLEIPDCGVSVDGLREYLTAAVSLIRFL